MGQSTPQPGRRMVDWGADMEQLADALGLDTFAVAGHSGGGPHALSVAHRMPDRVTRGVLASPVGPFDTGGYDRMLAMADLKLIVRLHRFRHLIRWAYRLDIHKAEKDMAAFIDELAKQDPSDAETFTGDPEQRAMFVANFTAGMEQDEEGVFEMTMALWDWGFDLADVAQPFHVFYGDADNVVEPAMPATLAQQLSNAEAIVWPGAGHYGFVDRDRWRDFLTKLTIP